MTNCFHKFGNANKLNLVYKLKNLIKIKLKLNGDKLVKL